MAHATTNTNFHPETGGLARLAAWVIDAMEQIAENNPRLRRARKLQAMTDAQLAILDIKRNDIVRVVFRDVY